MKTLPAQFTWFRNIKVDSDTNLENKLNDTSFLANTRSNERGRHFCYRGVNPLPSDYFTRILAIKLTVHTNF